MAATRHEPPFVAGLLAEEPLLTLDVAELAQTLARPFEALLKRRLQLDLRDEHGGVEDDDSASLGGLPGWWLRDHTLRLLERGNPDPRAAIRASGSLPPGALGDRQLEAALDLATLLRSMAEEVRGGAPRAPLLVDLALAKTRLVGVIDDRYPRGRVVVRAGDASAEQRVQLWVRHLVLQASGSAEPSTMVFVHGGTARQVGFGPVFEPLALLDDLVELHRAARRAPLPSFGDVSLTQARALVAGKEPEAVLDAVRQALEGSYDFAGKDPWMLRALRGHHPVDLDLPGHPDALAVMRRLFLPMIAAEVA